MTGADQGEMRVSEWRGPVVYQRWAGPEDLTILCVHGVFSTDAEWAGVADALRAWGTVVAPDLPGFGRTPLRRRGGIDDAAQAMAAVCRDEPGKRLVVLGTSMGAAVAVRMASSALVPVDGMVLGSGYLPAYFGGWRWPVVLAALLGEQVGNLSRATERWLLMSSLGEHPTTLLTGAEGEKRVGRRRPRLSELVELARATVADLAPLATGAMSPGATRREYARVRCPVLVMHGAEDPLVPAAWAYRAAADYGWDLRVVPSIAHLVKLGSPETWLHQVGDWLAFHNLIER